MWTVGKVRNPKLREKGAYILRERKRIGALEREREFPKPTIVARLSNFLLSYFFHLVNVFSPLDLVLHLCSFSES